MAKCGPKIFYQNFALKILLTCFGTPCLPLFTVTVDQAWSCWSLRWWTPSPSLSLITFFKLITNLGLADHHRHHHHLDQHYQAYNKPWPCWSPKWWTCADFHRGECVAQLGREAGNLNIIDSMVMLQIFCRWPWNILFWGLNFQFWFSIFCIVWNRYGLMIHPCPLRPFWSPKFGFRVVWHASPRWQWFPVINWF